jgi:CheY-like chemotaxis protein
VGGLIAAGGLVARILIVEDDHDFRSAVTDTLQLHGHEVVEAKDGLVAIELLGQGLQVDLILLDLRMPNMSGEEFLAAKQAVPQLAAVPVAVLSVWSDRAPHGGVVACVRKPVRGEDLCALADRYEPATA